MEKNSQTTTKRYFGLDVVRVMAFILLLWLHFFLRNGFYSQPVDSVAMTISVLLFLSAYRLECKTIWIAKVMSLLSGVTLEMYLISCVFDQQLYALQKGTYGPEEYLSRGLVLTGLVFAASFLSGWLIHWISAVISRGICSVWGIREHKTKKREISVICHTFATKK